MKHYPPIYVTVGIIFSMVLFGNVTYAGEFDAKYFSNAAATLSTSPFFNKYFAIKGLQIVASDVNEVMLILLSSQNSLKSKFKL